MVKVARSCGAPKSTREEFPMIGLVLGTHGRLADEFRAALEHVMGPQKQIEAITIGAEDDSDLCRSEILDAVNRADSGYSVALQPRDFLHEPPESGSARRHQSSHAGQARQGARGAFAPRRHRHGPGSRP